MRTQLSLEAKKILFSVFLTNIGNGTHTIAMSLLMYRNTGSVVAFGFVIIFEHLVSFLLQFIAGSMVDRGNPKWICVICDVGRGIAIMVIAAAMSLTNHWFYYVLALTLVINICKPFYQSATFSIIPNLCKGEMLQKFNAMVGTSSQLGTIIGTVSAAPLIAFMDTSFVILINGVTYILAGLAIAWAVIPKIETKESVVTDIWIGNLWSDWKEVFYLLKRETSLWLHSLISATDFLVIMFFNLTLVPMVTKKFQENYFWLSAFEFSFAAGAVVTSLFTTRIIRRVGATQLSFIGITMQGLLLFLYAFVDHWLAIMLISFWLASWNVLSIVVMLSTLQQRCVGPIRGRISSLRQLSVLFLTSILVPMVSYGTDQSLSTGYFIAGTLCLLIGMGVWILRHPKLFGENLFHKKIKSDP
ncbi:MFS transporter [Croceifilum oryzae]|nr:MFS transporter [Croceifilum oryzae]